jgi:quercetin dioxygenase-like cupin family protein
MKQDPVQIDPKHYKVEFENDKVRVLRVTFGPHEKSPMHSHPGGMIVYLTPHHSKHTDTSGASSEMTAKAGDVQWIDNTDHLPENLASQPMELILVELKP